jgi:hypothetical protein
MHSRKCKNDSDQIGGYQKFDRVSIIHMRMRMYLKYNTRLWTISDVIEANRRRMNNSPAAKNRQAIEMERLERMRDDVVGWNADVHGGAV